jgi:hypothetical protein
MLDIILNADFLSEWMKFMQSATAFATALVALAVALKKESPLKKKILL